ncbi:Hydroxyisourate hydrolase [Coprinellus micaceus]|uniref:5-hydroxyisourate hydrolase n=1 Tax=Coprinellus micaceus TaxID=71717 RepID=A0A4Y7TZ92_COPMI|nr:Hydroxyisourate hydrolase [Coprinellus micaceus]
MAKSPITCHILDAALGKPAPGVHIHLQKSEQSADAPEVATFRALATGITNEDGRCLDLLPPSGTEGSIALQEGETYKIVFKTKEYFEKTGRTTFYPWVEIPFTIQNPQEHYHIPLLISPFSFTTYRGS